MACTLLRNGSVYRNHTFTSENLLLADGRITVLEPDADISPIIADGAAVVDAAGMYVVPGFLDIHTHGAVGVDVNSASADDLEKVCRFAAKNGVTSWLCSILTDTVEKTNWCIDQYLAHKKMPHRGADLLGIHLEGPFLSPEYRGAMPQHLLRQADMELLRAYQRRACGDIHYITVSPEVENVTEAIPEISAMGIRVSIGHSGADYDTAMRAIQNGAVSATHIFNAMRPLHHHAPGIAGAALESDLYCEAICDGRHLHPGMVRLLLKIKGTDRVVAVTDSIMAAGLPDGNYKLGVNDVIVKDGDARLASADVRAGSTLTHHQALQNLLQFTGRPLADILPLFTENPAKVIGVSDHKGFIETGMDADVVLLDRALDVAAVYVGGVNILPGAFDM